MELWENYDAKKLENYLEKIIFHSNNFSQNISVSLINYNRQCGKEVA